MQVTQRKPKEAKIPVRIDRNKVELFYVKPVSLGYIYKEGRYWYSEDRMRFVASRDALDYLAKLHDLGGVIAPSVSQPTEEAPTPRTSTRKKPNPTRKKAVVEERKKIGPDDPLVQQFIEFINNQQQQETSGNTRGGRNKRKE